MIFLRVCVYISFALKSQLLNTHPLPPKREWKEKKENKKKEGKEIKKIVKERKTLCAYL